MRPALIRYVSVLVVFLAFDAVWLTLAAEPLYRAELGPLLKETFNLPVAVGFYAFFAASVVVFAVRPAVASGRSRTAFGYGALLGATAYGTYDLTNLATLAGYSATVAVVDMTWGTLVTGTSAALGYRLARWAKAA
ncbi:DUF2177 family protein [Chthonobacter rhizosphaerae]|uniref:DUF2177 family protein n=1 Tax=Chthonobacter rhizosphaerae TaxID=2735553 RepID=UPI0015EF0774